MRSRSSTEAEVPKPVETAAIEFSLNGEPASLDVPVRWTLGDVLREILGLTGTHYGCEHGVCGACTVLLDGQPVRSCLLLGVQADRHRVTTIEGLSDGDSPHALQLAFSEHHALQCGFCTPGFIMLAAGLLELEPAASEERIRQVLSSNLCRCTGYTPIVKAVLAVQRETIA
jgi:aerobic-type carbon monoxide dehydrogenase small subunit (CoxS/CutS family)